MEEDLTEMKKILVVENSPTIISVADSLLRQRGYDVTCLTDGQAAYQFARAEKPDLILTALGIAGLDGLELCKKLLTDPIVSGIPVILLVGEKDTAYMNKIDLCGARGRIKKPFSPKELLNIVEKYTSVGGEKPAPKLVDQTRDGAPKLKAKVEPSEVGTATHTVLSKTKTDSLKKHETVFNLAWEDIKDDAADIAASANKPGLDESGLILEEDQYGLTRLSEESVPFAQKQKDEDYDWFVGEMKKEIEDIGPKKKSETAPTSKPKTDVAYHDLGAPASKDESKYRQFLDQFKQDADIISQGKSRPDSAMDVNWLADRIAEKLAQKIVEKIDKQEIKQIIASFFASNK
jgi:CheY-like chemotaxis protein